jgi:hypothetical protein
MHVHGLVVLTDGVLGIVELVSQGQLLFVHLGPHGLGLPESNCCLATHGSNASFIWKW